jgi:hypothetical protein
MVQQSTQTNLWALVCYSTIFNVRFDLEIRPFQSAQDELFSNSSSRIINPALQMTTLYHLEVAGVVSPSPSKT